MIEEKATDYTIKIEINAKIKKSTHKRSVEIVFEDSEINEKSRQRCTCIDQLLNWAWIRAETLADVNISIKHCWIIDNAIMSIVEIRMTSVSWILQTSTIIWITLSNLYEIKRYLTTKQMSALNNLLSLYITFEVINKALLFCCLVDQICMRKDWMSKQSEWKRKFLWQDLQDSMNSK